MKLADSLTAAINYWNREQERIQRELRMALLKIFRRMRGLPEFVKYCQQKQRKAARRAKYYRRMEFYKRQRKKKGRQGK